MRPSPELLFVHIPRTGGTSVVVALREALGEEELLLDYEDRPVQPESPINVDFGAWHQRARAAVIGRRSWPRVVAGHFWLGKYEPFLPDALCAAWLRDPVDRLVSIYIFWRAAHDAAHSELAARVYAGELSFHELVELPAMRNQISRVYLRGYERPDLDFVGDFDSLDADFRELCGLLGVPAPPLPHARRTTAQAYAGFRLSSRERERVCLLNAEDVELYATWRRG